MIRIINSPNTRIAYFRQEDYGQLLSSGVNKRTVEKDGVQTLLKELGFGGREILYKTSGQPYFKERSDVFLSVSHAKGWFAVSIGSKPVGVDIQTYSPRLIEGQDYFRNERELPFSENEKALHLIWGAKEAFYKLKEGRIADLKQDVSILEIAEDSLILDFESDAYKLGYKILDAAFIVFTL